MLIKITKPSYHKADPFITTLLQSKKKNLEFHREKTWFEKFVNLRTTDSLIGWLKWLLKKN